MHRQAVADHDPVGAGAVKLAALAAYISYHLGVVALAGHDVGLGLDGSQYVKIHETIVDRGDKRIGHRVREPHQIAIGARCVDGDKVKGSPGLADGRRELGKFRSLVVGDLHGAAEIDAVMLWKFERQSGPSGPGAPVLDVVGKALLPAVEIDGGDALARFQQRDRYMKRDGRLARPALFVTQHYDMCRAGLPRRRLY